MKRPVVNKIKTNHIEISEELFQQDESIKKNYFSGDLLLDIPKIKALYSYPKNIDFTVREFTIHRMGRKAVIFFIPSLTDTKLIEEEIITPLISGAKDIIDIPSAISISTIKEEKVISGAVSELNTGATLLLVEGISVIYILKTDSAAGRSVEKPQNETTLLGPKESFVEKADQNISLIRKKIRSEDFTVEKMIIGSRSQNEVYIIYNKELVGGKILTEVKSRIESVQKDAVQNLGLLNQHIEDRSTSLFPTILQTERPDRAASFIEDGHDIVVMNNSPFALVTPATFWSFYHSADDHYLRFIYGNFTRLLRMTAMFITLFTPAIYIAITNYHIEMLPADLLLAIAGAREMVPFPAILELLLMEMAFELIREAGIRVPTPIGPTIGIVGALILGQAAVEANLVSPIVVIVVALTGLSSFAISDVNLNYAIRIARFGFLLSASLFGIFGMVGIFMTGLFYLSVVKTFGVPYLAPLTPKYKSSKDTLFRRILKNEKLRPAYVKTYEDTNFTSL
ncbi:spore germination protein [Neobacillus sp. DY30]|uniref:spore germination protein n=1 Tax=Neobacillus sp. DY30 TaxID=3047871 RepID=UPI0024BFB27D|nr:spore germination protein [Neobacillus sp. DY30]WHY03037.1 spore germination protein [Neobacillus sp. DY30]